MDLSQEADRGAAGRRLASHWRHPQNANAYLLVLNTLAGAASGVAFWWVMTRVVELPPSAVGIGYTVIAAATMIAIVAKGGFDTAIIRALPRATDNASARLVTTALLVGSGASLALWGVIALVAAVAGWNRHIDPAGWLLVGALAVMLVVTWLQDASFVADQKAHFSLARNAVFAVSRIALPLLILVVAVPHPVALAWLGALVVSAAAAAAMRRRPRPAGDLVPSTRAFLHTAARNLWSNAAEMLPGLILVPLVLAVDGPEGAAYFGIAWAAASLLFLASSAIGRSALAQMAADGHVGAPAVRRGAWQMAWLIVPAAVLGVALAPFVLGVFGPAYAAEGAAAFRILCASALLVAPFFFMLAIWRAQERTAALVVTPAAVMVVLVVTAPWTIARFGVAGAAWSWFAAIAIPGAVSIVQLRRMTQGVSGPGLAASFRSHSHAQ